MEREKPMTPADLRAWQAHMGYTYDTAAAALGVSRSSYADWVAGRSRTTGKPIKISRLVALACAALENSAGKRPARKPAAAWAPEKAERIGAQQKRGSI